MLTNKLKVLKCSTYFFLEIMKHDLNHKVRIHNPLPADATVVRVFQDGIYNNLNFVIASESFPLLKDGDLIPNIETPTFEQVYE